MSVKDDLKLLQIYKGITLLSVPRKGNLRHFEGRVNASMRPEDVRLTGRLLHG